MNYIKDFVKSYWKTLLFFGIVGLVGGFFTGLYLLDSYPEDFRDVLVTQLGSAGLADIPVDIMLATITALQSLGYGVILGAIGIVLGKRIGLFRDERNITKKPLAISFIISIVGGLALILSDMLYFGRHSTVIMDSYGTKPSVDYIIATVTYGAVIEEVMLRLFAMSLVAFILHLIFGKRDKKPAPAVLIAANVISALLFAAGHLPATLILIGNSPMIIARCFLLNGGIGLLFGYLYRKYGLRYAMIAHGGCHIVSKLIWILFI